MPRTRISQVHAQLVGERVRAARTGAGMTQQQMADRMGVKQPSIAAIEAGRTNPTLGQLAAIADALGSGLDVQFPSLPRS